VSTAILVADDDDEDDERNQNVDEGPGSELKKQNKTEEVPLKTNNIFSSLVDRSKFTLLSHPAKSNVVHPKSNSLKAD
jgi:hypothetical protein